MLFYVDNKPKITGIKDKLKKIERSINSNLKANDMYK